MKINKGKIIEKKVDRGQHSIFEKFPYKRMEGNSVVLSDDSYLGFLKVDSANLYNMNPKDAQKLMDSLTMMENIYEGDHCILSLMFPFNTEPQVTFWNKMMIERQKEHDIVGVRTCQHTIQRLNQMQKEYPSLAFYIKVYADTKTMLKDLKGRLKRFGNNNIQLKELDEIEVKQLLKRQNNLNTINYR